jgi:16S rRNA (uracil1498-N3)-methyltransferase
VSESASEAIPTYLAQALAKGERMDLVVQKSTELGARAVAPFTCERSVVRLEPSRAAQRVERWRRIAAAAAAQCGRSDLPAIWPISSLEQVLERASQDGMRALMLWEQERATRLSEAVSEQPGPLMLVVGPEGGFSEEEVARARALGARTVSLGRRVLRTETAALAALAVVQFLRGDLG